MANLTSDFRDNRSNVRVPLADDVFGFDFFAFSNDQRRTLGHTVLFKFTTAIVGDDDFTITIKNNGFTFVVGYRLHLRILDDASLGARLFVFFNVTTGHTTNVECTHGQLSTRFTNRLSSDDADRHALFNKVTGGHVHSVATTANTQRCFTSHRASDLNALDAHAFELSPDFWGDHLAFFDDHFIGNWVNDVLT